MTETLNSIVSACLANDLDFEVWNGETTTHGRPVRKQMLIRPAGHPEVLVNFGDNKHGNKVVATYLAGNHAPVRISDVLKVVEANKTQRKWSRDIAKSAEPESTRLNLRLEKGKVVVQDAVVVSNDNNEYVVEKTDHYMVVATGEYVSSEKTSLVVVFPEESERFKVGQRVSFSGEFVYPNRILVVTV